MKKNKINKGRKAAHLIERDRGVLLKIILFAMLISILILSGSARAGFNISYDCIDKYCYEGKEILWKVMISNEGLEKMTVSSIIIMDSSNKIITETTGSEIESDSYKNFILRSKIPKPDNFTTFYFRPCFKIYSNDTGETLRCYELMNLTVMPYPLKNCKNDFDCEQNRYCNNGICFNLSCDYCSYVYNHSCIRHECCRDYECKDDEKCEENKCVFLNCNFDEEFKNHACAKLNCGFLKSPVMHKCEYPKELRTAFRWTLFFAFSTIFLLILFSVKIKGENIAKHYKRIKEINLYKKLEKESLKKAETHYKLLNYLNDKKSIEKHKKLIEQYEREAEKYRKRWQKYFKNTEICPACEREIPKGYEFCPYCNAKLR
ncbi:MAG: hypothetical protein ACP5OZ_04540 [Candidatus Woesearchaeota archaeon]